MASNNSVDFLEIKKGKAKIDWGYRINQRIDSVIFPLMEDNKELFNNSNEYYMHSVLDYSGYRIFGHSDLEVPTYYPLNGKDTYSLVALNETELIGKAVSHLIPAFTKFLQRKIEESGKMGEVFLGCKIVSDFEEARNPFRYINGGGIAWVKSLYNQYHHIQYHLAPDDITEGRLASDIRDEWEESSEFQSYKDKFIQLIHKECGAENFTKKEAQKIIVEAREMEVINDIKEIQSDIQFMRKLERYNELKQDKQDIEKFINLLTK